MLCRKCGAELPEDAKTCQFCGAAVTEETDVPMDEDAQIRQRQMNKMVEEKKQRLNEIQQRRDTKKAKQKRNKIILIVVLCAAGVACAAMGGIYWNGVRTAPGATPVATLPAATIAPASTPITSPVASVSPLPTSVAASWEATGNTGSGSSDATGGNGTSGGSSSSGKSTGGGGSLSSSGASGSTGSGNGSSSSGNTSGSSTGGSSASSGNTSGGTGSDSVQSSARNSGISSDNIAARLSQGEEVIEDNGRYYMTFISDGVRYYANVNAGATTAQVRNMTYTLDAVPTSDTYNGNTVYEITSMTKYNGNDYILPNSGTVLLTKSDIAGMSKEDLALARNEIYARHGRKFQSAVYQQYFESKSWYKENPSYNYDDENANLNEIEIKNVQFIIDAEK